MAGAGQENIKKKLTDSSVILTETAINALESQRHYPEILQDFGVSG